MLGKNPHSVRLKNRNHSSRKALSRKDSLPNFPFSLKSPAGREAHSPCKAADDSRQEKNGRSGFQFSRRTGIRLLSFQ
ncbi:MAG: hypothetical protein EGS44_10425 [Akkermansia muciniphila]|nr:hypothetical protein [Akkermansia muciniphila]